MYDFEKYKFETEIVFRVLYSRIFYWQLKSLTNTIYAIHLNILF